jgi:Ca2+-transporting ATPase
VIQTIHASVAGRARYKVPGLYRSPAVKQQLEAQLSYTDGIHHVSANPVTGNVLVIYDGNRSSADIAALLARLMHEPQTTPPHPSQNGNAPPRQPEAVPPTGDEPAPVSEHAAIPQKPRALRKLITQAQEQQEAAWHCIAEADVLSSWQTCRTNGLPRTLAQERLQTYGPNILPEAVPRSEWSIFLSQLMTVPVALLSVSAGVSLFTGGVIDALVILGVVATNATIGYITESQSEKTIHSLKHLVTPSALVLRDGQKQELSAAEIVPGDLLVLQPGTYVAADSRLIDIHRLSVDESTLTGESLPVHKQAAILPEGEVPLADRVNMVHMGTLVTGGQGLAVVVATGRYTEIGKIQTLAGEAQAPETPMQRQLDEMGTQLVVLSGAVCGAVFGVGVLRGYGLLTMLNSAISLAVAAVPEGLPTVATTTLALGIRTMRQHHVLIRRLDAVEGLGCVQTICLDKTGTLTENRMSTVAVYAGMQRTQITHGRFLVDNTWIDPRSCLELLSIAQVCVLCSETVIERQEDGEYRLTGSATENALIQMTIDAGVEVMQLRADFPTLQTTLRAEDRNYMRTVHALPPGQQNGTTDASQFVAVKGSPGEVLAMCAWHLKDGQQVALTDEDRLAIETANQRMAGEALRVLGTAYRYVAESTAQTDLRNGLIWLGLVGMADPVRIRVKEVIADFHQAGIETVMITGDQSPTAYAIGKELALSRSGALETLDSTHLANLAPEVMSALAQKVQVFARVSPAHKLQIVQALQRAGKVVAMTGDGVNDGPALKAADIGIAMGNTGTDVAREVADVVLEDDNLDTMIVAVSEGRTIYQNIRKAVHFLLATNLSEIIVMSTAISTGLGQPLNAMQLLWINLISDIFPGLALALEPPEPDVLTQPPRNPADPILSGADLQRIGIESSVISAGTLAAYGYGLLRYGMGPQASTLAFTSITIGELLNAITARSERHSIFDATPLPANPYLTAALIGSFGLQALTLLVPGLRNLLNITPISLLDGLVIGGSTLVSLLVNEATKKQKGVGTEEMHPVGKAALPTELTPNPLAA